MRFKIIKQCFQSASDDPESKNYDFYLEQDKWDDFNYHTLYHVHAVRGLTGERPEYLGSINIMKLGQKTDEYYLIKEEIGSEFTSLPDDFCSVSMSVELYRGLYHVLTTASQKKEFVDALKMIFSKDSERYERFKDEDCFKTSLMRNASMDAYALAFGKEIMFDEASSYDLARIPLKYRLPESEEEVSFDFTSENPDLQNQIDIPSRLLACIGNNGAGKSTILYRLARILYSTPSARAQYAGTLGTITPSDAGFRRLFLISYSAFDNFILPGTKEEYPMILQGLKNRNGRLVFCGIRDVESEYKELIDKEYTNNEESPFNELFNFALPHDYDHGRGHRLKTVDDLANEFVVAYMNIAKDENKRKLWNRLMDECNLANDSFSSMCLEELAWLFPEGTLNAEGYKQLSTGIKYLLHSLANILDRIETNSMIIFDEPENHIQPPLLCKFLYCLRIISNEYTSLVLVATHSPVILQETLKKNVLVVRRDGSDLSFRTPHIETFGENIGNITDEVFNLNTSVTNYQNTAAKIFKLLPPKQRHLEDPVRYLRYVERKIGMQFGNEINAYLISQLLELKQTKDVES